jgi:ankyrin repeat protein
VILLAGITPLAFAAAHGQVIAARYFLDKGANPNKKNSSRGTTPLHEAAEAGAMSTFMYIFGTLITKNYQLPLYRKTYSLLAKK